MRYDSGWEPIYAERLELLRKSGEIKSWRRIDSNGSEFPLEVNGFLIGHHNPDFFVVTKFGKEEVHEIKAEGGPAWHKQSIAFWKWKRKHFMAQYFQYEYITMTKDYYGWREWGKKKIPSRKLRGKKDAKEAQNSYTIQI